MQPIRTKYRGIEYRSRLEATWAAFFYGVGISAEYEAIDLPGWIPDFVIPKKGELGGYKELIVEVRPTAGGIPDDIAFSRAMKAINDAGLDTGTGEDWEIDYQPVLFLGYSLPGDGAIGYLHYPTDIGDGLALAYLSVSNTGYGIAHTNGGSCADIINGTQRWADAGEDEVSTFFKYAKNETQWNPGSRRKMRRMP